MQCETDLMKMLSADNAVACLSSTENGRAQQGKQESHDTQDDE
jgi:hypothetical protein